MFRKLGKPGTSLRVLLGVAVVVAGAFAMVPASAASQTVDQGTWGGVYSTWSCGHGVTASSPYSCTYTTSAPTFSNQCAEAGANAGGGIGASVSCSITVSVTTQVAPILNAAGKVIGCTSVATTASGNAKYASGSGLWNATIPISTADIHGVNVNNPKTNGAGTLAYHGHTVDTSGYYYTVDGTIAAAQCAASSSGSNTNGAGNVTVAVTAAQ